MKWKHAEGRIRTENACYILVFNCFVAATPVETVDERDDQEHNTDHKEDSTHNE